MPYSYVTLRHDLKRLNVAAWDWAGAKKAPFDFEELSRYCWRSYEAAYHAAGDMVIGRVPHLNAAGLYEKVGDIVGERTLFDTRAAGNLLKMDKWARVMNDSWILGGVHRGATFRLASPRVLENLWNQADAYLVVTGRELLGLLHFGYELEQAGPYKVLRLREPGRASAANLVEYDRLIRSSGTFRRAIDLIDKNSPQARLMAEIRERGQRA